MQSTNYFQNFKYTIYNGFLIRNLLSRAELVNLNTLSSSKLYLPYLIKDGERPESIALSYYGDTAYFWLILLANDIRNVYEDWPKSQDILDQYIIEKYGSLEYAKATTSHYEDKSGNWIPNTNDITTSSPITIYDYEYELNEKKRNIKIIQSQYRNQIVKEFQNLFQ